MKKFLIVLLLIFCGCATLPERSSDIKPGWITKKPESNNGIYFVGISMRTPTLDEGRKLAVNDALLRTIQYLGVKVKGHLKLVINSMYSDIKKEVETKSYGKIEGTHLQEIYYETWRKKDTNKKEYDVYVLIWYPHKEISKAKELLRKENAAQLARVREIYTQANKQELAGKILPAFQSYSFALKILEESEDIEGLGEKIINQALNTFNRIKITKLKAPKTGLVKTGLSKPLQVKITYVSSKKKSSSLSEIPVEFNFVSGRGELDKFIFTDEKGIVSCYVSRIDSISKNNRVESGITLVSLVKTDISKFKGIINQVQPKKVFFVFSSTGNPVDIRPEKKLIVIDSFINLTKDANLNWLSSGLTDVITNKLSNINVIEIISSKNLNEESLKRPGGKLIAINGSYQKDKNGLRIIAKMKDLKTDKVIGASMVNGKLDNIFTMQDDLAIKITGALDIKLTGKDKTKLKSISTRNLVAYKFFSKAFLHFFNEEYDRAIPLYEQAIKNDPLYADAYNNLGLAYYKKKMYDKAIELYTKATSLSISNERPRVNMAVAYYTKGNKDRAVYILSQVHGSNPYAFEAFLLLGTIYNEKNLYDKAIDSFLKALKIKPGSAKAHNGLGIAYQNKDLTNKAKESFKKAISLNKYFEKAHNNLGIIYDKQGKYDKAIFHYQMATYIYYRDAAAWSNMGLAYSHKGLPEMALNAYKQAIEYSPQMPEAYFNLASFFSSQRETDLAIQCLEKAIRLGFNDSKKLKEEKNLDNIRSDTRYLNLIKYIKD